MTHPSHDDADGARRVPELVSVVIPVLNAADTLGAQFEGLSQQDYEGEWEIVLSENGSIDDTRDLAESWSDRLPIRIVDSSARRGYSVAANAGARAAKGDLLLFCDGDDIVTPQWISAFVNAASEADVLGGWCNPEPLNSALVRSWRGRPLEGGLHDPLGMGAVVPAGNMAIWTELFDDLGGFHEDYGSIQDAEFSIRAHRKGLSVLYVPEAELLYRYRDSVGGLGRQTFQYTFYMERLRREVGHSPPGPFSLDSLKSLGWLLVRLPYLAMSPRRRGIWVKSAAGTWGSSWGRFWWWLKKPVPSDTGA